MKSLTHWAVALLLTIVVGASYLLDGPSDAQAAQDVADEAEYAAALADGGRAKCAALGRTPLWTADGDLICRRPPAVLAQGGAR